MYLHSEKIHQFVKSLTDAQPSMRALIVSLMPDSPDEQDVLDLPQGTAWFQVPTRSRRVFRAQNHKKFTGYRKDSKTKGSVGCPSFR